MSSLYRIASFFYYCQTIQTFSTGGIRNNILHSSEDANNNEIIERWNVRRELLVSDVSCDYLHLFNLGYYHPILPRCYNESVDGMRRD